MKTVEANSVAQATLFEIYAPVERYFQELQARTGQATAPRVTLQAEDAYLLHLIVGFHAPIQAVLDLAGAATWGATTVLLASQERRCRVLAAGLEEDSNEAGWPAALREALNSADGKSVVEFLPRQHHSLDQPALAGNFGVDRRPVLVVVPWTTQDDGSPVEALNQILTAHPTAIVVLLPIGRMGEDARLAGLLDWQARNKMRFAALRELSPCLAASQLGVVFAEQAVEFVETLKRLERLFTGNFDFLSLGRQAYVLSMANTQLQVQLRDARAKIVELESSLVAREALTHAAHSESDKMALRIEDLVQSIHQYACQAEGNAQRVLRLEEHIRDLTGGKAWSLVQKLSRLRRRLVPRNSLRERCGRFVFALPRRLRAWTLPAR